MATTYVVLMLIEWEGHAPSWTLIEETLEANSAEHARRRAAERLDSDENGDLEKEGVTLIAVSARNWKTGRGTLKVETQRRIRSS